MLSTAIIAIVISLAALAVGIVGLVQAHRAGLRASAANELSREANDIARGADDRAKATADREADTVEWRLDWQAPGRLLFWNRSREHTAYDVKIIASLGRLPVGTGPSFGWPYDTRQGKGQTVSPQMPAVADYAALAGTAEVARALDAAGPTEYLLMSAVTWTSERGVERQYWADARMVVLEVGPKELDQG